MNREEQSRIKHRTRSEHAARVASEVISHAQRALGVSWFVALSRMHEVIVNFFKKNVQYFFAVGLLLTFTSWVISTIEFATAANKNRGKLMNYLYLTFGLVFSVATATVFIFASMVAGSAMFVASMFFDTVLNIGHALYFGFQAYATNNLKEKAYFKKRILNHGLFALFASLVSVAFLLLMSFGIAMPFGVSMLLGGIGITVILLPYFIKAANWVKLKFASQPKSDAVQLESISSEQVPAEQHPLLTSMSAAPHYDFDYNHVIAEKPESWQALRLEANNLIMKIENDYTRDEKAMESAAGIYKITTYLTFWTQREKRQNKIAALEYLKDIVDDLESAKETLPKVARAENPLMLGKQSFHYNEKNQLIDEVAYHVLKAYAGVFQSFYKDIGAVQACFNKLFLCMMEDKAQAQNEQNEQRVTYAI